MAAKILQRSADWQSAVSQVGNLRLEFGHFPACKPTFVATLVGSFVAHFRISHSRQDGHYSFQERFPRSTLLLGEREFLNCQIQANTI